MICEAWSVNLPCTEKEFGTYVFGDGGIESVEAAGCEGIEPALCDAFDLVRMGCRGLRSGLEGSREEGCECLRASWLGIRNGVMMTVVGL